MKPTAEFDAWVRSEVDAVEAALQAWVPEDAPAGLGIAMRYGVLDGGKRLRPLLVLAAAQAVHGHAEAAMRAAVAVELIHAYSLVHDDMPCMDNDVLRRGKPTVHVQFGEAQAMLAGDAMQALAFEVLTPFADEMSAAGGPSGVPPALQASVLMGAACGEVSAAQWSALADYGDALGLAFQVVDDILDVTQASSTLGKTAGKDLDNNKPTYVTVLGLDAARRHANELRDKAQSALARSGLVDAAWLSLLADRVVERDS